MGGIVPKRWHRQRGQLLLPHCCRRRINRPVLTVMEALWAAKEQMEGLPDQTVHKYPPRPSTAYRLAYQDGALHAR